MKLNQIIHGDCLDVMKEIPDNYFDLVLTDPPYGIGLAGGFSGAGGFSKPIARRKYNGSWDDKIPDIKIFKEIFRISKEQIICGGNYFSHILPQNNHWVVWDKLNTMPTFSDCELIWTSINRNSVMKFVYDNNGLKAIEKNRQHPTQKPVELMVWCLENYLLKKWDKDRRPRVFDGFAGSGTTGVACKKCGCDYLLVEKEKDYVEICEKRLRQETLF